MRSIKVNHEMMIERLFPLLIAGDRGGVRSLFEEEQCESHVAEDLTKETYWPLLEMIQTMYRADQLTKLAYHYSTRLMRGLVDRAQLSYEIKERRGRKMLMFSGPSEAEELAGQMMADLAEADGYEVYYGGGGIARDEIIAEVGSHRPDILMMFGSSAQDAPGIREVIDTVREIATCPNLQIVVGGGVFNRAEGLAAEIGADLWAKDPVSLLVRLAAEPERRATTDQRTVGKNCNQSAAA